MIQQLVKNGFQQEAYEQIKPMLARVIKNKGFYEWYTKDNKPEGSGTFRGEAGVLYDAISLLENTGNNPQYLYTTNKNRESEKIGLPIFIQFCSHSLPLFPNIL
ncbi:hypothetical protein KUH03_35810 [Sphingobacterium sp. E70]|uniref:hypothetical protein n=1 Tax=Sphingobacterium sp. E70 TaxID=2853439 RepID=UPI00211BEC8B|nr:hypothetical protein [Sphingobacterium sp. E70]ULT24330.1 hypothetical protein KUH03_35810 [Sphingobacterium sp. E70]